MILHDSMDNYHDHPIQILERARSRTRHIDWMADAILIEAQFAIARMEPSRKVGDFARIILTRLRE